MSRDYEQVALDCAVLRQAITDLRMWRRPFPNPDPDWPESELFLAFCDAARWIFNSVCHGEWHFSFQTVCSRLSVDGRKVRDAICARLTRDQRAWMAWLGVERGLARGRA